MDVARSWDLCPVEILIMIFEFLEMESLYQCIFVNKQWRAVAVKVISIKGLWQAIVEKYMLNSGKSYLRKSKLHWHYIFMNSLQWYDAKYIGLEPAHKLDRRVKTFFVTRDNLIIVTEDRVKHFSIETLQCVRTLNYVCNKFEESDDVIVTMCVAFPVIMMHGKLHKKDYGCLEKDPVTRHNVLFHSLEDNRVYIMTNDKKILYIYIWENSKWKRMGIRFYGLTDIIAGTVHNGKMHILTEGGKTYRTNRPMISFETYKHSNCLMPSSMKLKGLAIFSDDILVILGDTAKPKFHYTYDIMTNTIFLECPGLSTFTQHGDVLFLGYHSGMVEILIPLNMIKNDGKPELSFYVKVKRSIVGLDVYENIDAHDVFIHTPINLSHFRIPFVDPSGFSQCFDQDAV